MTFPTLWLNLVDNVMMSLYFAFSQSNEYGYVFIYGIKAENVVSQGVWEGKRQRLVDLRESFPPIALRPHIQHAFLLTDINNETIFKEILEKNYRSDDQNDNFFGYDAYKDEEHKIQLNYINYTLGIIKIPMNILSELYYESKIYNKEILFPKEDYSIFNKLYITEEYIRKTQSHEKYSRLTQNLKSFKLNAILRMIECNFDLEYEDFIQNLIAKDYRMLGYLL